MSAQGLGPGETTADDPRPAIRAEARALGFDQVGFAPVTPHPEQAARLTHSLAEGRHGEMAWMEREPRRRASVQGLWPEARSVVVLGMDYGPAADPLARLQHRDRAAISVYAQGRDYHDVIKPRLKALARLMVDRFGGDARVFVDTAPVMEKPLGQAAGLGWQGKHTNLVSRQHGSWLFLGEVFTTLALRPDPSHGDRCGSCRTCQDACPTQAFPAPYQLDARRCLSYLTIEHKGHIPPEFRRPMGNRIYGCDDCLAVCPWNKFATRARENAFHPRAELTAPRLLELAALDDGDFRDVFAGSPIKRIGRDRFVRNVAIALGNSGDQASVPVLERLAEDASPLVRAMAIWALRQLLPAHGFAALRGRLRAAEPDAAVRAELGGIAAEEGGADETGADQHPQLRRTMEGAIGPSTCAPPGHPRPQLG